MAGEVASGGRGQNKQRIDDKNTDPRQSAGHDHREQRGKAQFRRAGMRPPAAGQSRTQRPEQQAVEEKEKQRANNHSQPCQPGHIAAGHREHVADKKARVARKVTAAGKNHNAERNSESHDQTDGGIGRQSAAPTEPGDGQSKHEREADHRPERVGQTEQHTQCDAGEGRMADCLGKKRHAVGHHHRAQRAEQR